MTIARAKCIPDSARRGHLRTSWRFPRDDETFRSRLLEVTCCLGCKINLLKLIYIWKVHKYINCMVCTKLINCNNCNCVRNRGQQNLSLSRCLIVLIDLYWNCRFFFYGIKTLISLLLSIDCNVYVADINMNNLYPTLSLHILIYRVYTCTLLLLLWQRNCFEKWKEKEKRPRLHTLSRLLVFWFSRKLKNKKKTQTRIIIW